MSHGEQSMDHADARAEAAAVAPAGDAAIGHTGRSEVVPSSADSSGRGGDDAAVAPAADDAAQTAADEVAPAGVDDAQDAGTESGVSRTFVGESGVAEAVGRGPSGDAGHPREVRPGAENDADEEVARPLDDQELRSALEAMLLVVDAPASVELLAAAVDDAPARIERVLREMSAEWTARGSGIDLRYVGDGWRLYTRTEYAPYVERMLLDGARSKLTRAALETLAVIAYRQPVTRARVSAVRGVNVDGVIRTLVARGLIAEAGADVDTNGTLYVTTELFLERIGLASLAELPSLAPLLPGVDLIDEINESLDTDPRYTKLKKPAESDIDLGTED